MCSEPNSQERGVFGRFLWDVVTYGSRVGSQWEFTCSTVKKVSQWCRTLLGQVLNKRKCHKKRDDLLTFKILSSPNILDKYRLKDQDHRSCVIYEFLRILYFAVYWLMYLSSHISRGVLSLHPLYSERNFYQLFYQDLSLLYQETLRRGLPKLISNFHMYRLYISVYTSSLYWYVSTLITELSCNGSLSIRHLKEIFIK